MRSHHVVLLAVVLAVLACGSSSHPASSTPPSASSAPAAVKDPLKQDVALAFSTTADAPTKHLTTIAITRRELRLLGDSAFAVPMPDAESWTHGMPAEVKRNGPNDLFLVPLAGWLANVHDTHDVSIIADAAVPYRLLMEVLFTSAQADLDTFHLVVSRAEQPAEIVVRAPHADPKTLALPLLTVLVVSEGVGVKLAGGNVAPGCQGTGPGLAVPHAKGAVDQSALRACIRAIGGTAPAPIQAGMVAANPPTPFSEIVATLDALRASGVTDVSLGLAR